jgi:hypothetical protein
MCRLDAAEESCGGQRRFESSKFSREPRRRFDYRVSRIVSRADTEGVFTERCATAKAAMSDLLMETPRRRNRSVQPLPRVASLPTCRDPGDR